MKVDYSPLALVGKKVSYKMIWRDKVRRLYAKWMLLGPTTAVATVFAVSMVIGKGIILGSLFALVAAVVAVPTVFILVKLAYTAGLEYMYLRQFIKQNNFKPISAVDANEPGLIFRQMDSFHNVVGFELSGVSLPTRIFNFRGQIDRRGLDKAVAETNSIWFYFTVIRVQLPLQLPNIIIDSHVNNGSRYIKFRSLSEAWLNKHQKIDLEGNFNKFFTVFVPKGYEADALYVLTPELMQIMIAHGSDYDFEIVDNYLYMSHMYVTKFTAENTRQLIEQAEFFADQFGQNTRRYNDQRTAGGGKRLQSK